MEFVFCMRQSMSFMNGVILKLNFEKAYNKVKWSFLEQTLRMKGFSPEWRALINNFVSRVSVTINVNDDTGHYFQTMKGLRQATLYQPCYVTCG
jgi:hypothetical protein